MNKVILLGRLTKDPTLKYTTVNNTAVCSFTLAINRRFKKDEADFINCQAWQKTAEFITQYFAKGSQISVVGRIQTRNYDGNDGKKVYVTEVIVEETYFAGSKGNSQQNETAQTTHEEVYDPNGVLELPF